MKTEAADKRLMFLARASIEWAKGNMDGAVERLDRVIVQAADPELERELTRVYRTLAIRAILATAFNELRSEGKVARPRGETPIKTTDYDLTIERPRPPRPGDWMYDDVHGMTPKANIRRYLESVLVQGRPIGDCTVAEVDAAATSHERSARFMRLLTHNLPPEAIIREHRSEEDAALLWAKASTA
jgi:hypothetical protein